MYKAHSSAIKYFYFLEKHKGTIWPTKQSISPRVEVSVSIYNQVIGEQ